MSMNGRYLLDTNMIALFGGGQSVVDSLATAPEVFIPSIVLGELYYGAQRSTRVAENSTRVDAFAAESVVLSCNASTARWYGIVKSDLRLKGRPIPENDVWIAALARQHDLTVVSRDGHFEEVPDLDVVAW